MHTPPVVAFVQWSNRGWGTYDGIDLFEEAADDVVAEIARRGITPDAVLPGVRIAGAATFGDEAMAEGAQALVY